MRHHIIEVLPYDPSYRVFSTSTSKIVAEFEHLTDAIEFIRHNVTRSYGPRLQADGPITVYCPPWHEKYPSPTYVPPPENWLLTDEFGDEVSTDNWLHDRLLERYAYREKLRKIRSKKYDEFKVSLWGTKASPRKIKRNCQTFPDVDYSGKPCYTNHIRGYHRYPKTQRERRLLDGIINEYGEALVRGERRNLPTNWDDRVCTLGHAEPSWKHNSKRKKQWIPK